MRRENPEVTEARQKREREKKSFHTYTVSELQRTKTRRLKGRDTFDPKKCTRPDVFVNIQRTFSDDPFFARFHRTLQRIADVQQASVGRYRVCSMHEYAEETIDL